MNNRVICYRPEMNAVWGSVTANLFVEQVHHWWKAMGKKAFYKFNAPCDSPYYREGDSWQEELGFKKSEFLSARKQVARRVEPGENKDELLKNHVVVFWRDQQNRNWYAFNEDIYDQKYAETYGTIEPEPPKKETEAEDKSDQPDPPATPSEIRNLDSAKSGIPQSDNNIDDSHIDNKKKKGIPSDWVDKIFEEPDLSKKPSDFKNQRSKWIVFWEENKFIPLGPPPFIATELRKLAQEHGEDKLLEAMQIAVIRGAPNLAYVKAVLANKLKDSQPTSKSRSKPARESFPDTTKMTEEEKAAHYAKLDEWGIEH